MHRPTAVLPDDLYSAAQVRAFDRVAIDELGIPGYTLMERAGEAAFTVLRETWPDARRVVVVCGGGNNGGDGYIVARLAREAGLDVTLLRLGDPAKLAGDARRAADAWLAAGGSSEPFNGAHLAAADVVVDAIFGTGLERPVTDSWAEAVTAINTSGAAVLALDIPSGLHAERGVALGVAIHAAATVTFIGVKPGLLTGAGPDYCGALHYANLDVPMETFTAVEPLARLLGDADLAGLGVRRRTAHKGDHGHLLVVGGDVGMAGAVLLAGTAALRCGAGRVTVATAPGHAAALTAARPELMCYGVDGPRALRPLLARADAIAVGPGLGRGAWGAGLFAAAVDSRRPLVIDADALFHLAAEALPLTDVVMTPHPGEAARLLGCSIAEIEQDRLAAVTGLHERYGAVAVLKGAGTLVSGVGDSPGLCRDGNPGMAVAGMGDVLTGVIGALRVQGLDAAAAANAGVLLHARAADAAAADGERGLLPSDLFVALRRLVNAA